MWIPVPLAESSAIELVDKHTHATPSICLSHREHMADTANGNMRDAS